MPIGAWMDMIGVQAVQRTEQHEEVRGLQARRPVSERHRRDEQREPAELHREQELSDELASVRIWRAHRRGHRLARQDHHVADLIQDVLGRQESAISDCSDQTSDVLPMSPRRGGLATTVSLRHSVRDHQV